MSIRTDKVDLILTINAAQSASTLKDMEARARDLRRALSRMDVNDEAFKEAAKEAQNLDKRIKDVKLSMQAVRNEPAFPALQERISRVVVALGAAYAAVRTFFSGLTGSAKLEQLNIAFETFLGSADKAKRVVADLRKFADLTPFEVEPVNNAGRALLAFGFSAEELIPTLTRVGDVASGTGKDFNELALIYGKARAEGVIQNDTLNQLAEAGIPIYQELAKVLKVNEGQIRKLAEQGKIGFKDLERVFVNLTSEGGRFAGLMERQSKSLEGLFSTLSSAIEGKLTSVMNNLLPLIKSVTQGFIDFISVPLSETLEEERRQFNGLSVQLYNTNVGSNERKKIINSLTEQYPSFLKGIDAEKVTNEQLQPILDKINQTYIVRIALQKSQEKLAPLIDKEAESALFLADRRRNYNVELAKGAELAGINLATIDGEEAKIKAVVTALELKVKAQGRNFSFSATEEAIALNRLRNQYSINQAVQMQEIAAKRVTDAQKEQMTVVDELKKIYGSIVDEVLNPPDPPAPTNNGGAGLLPDAKAEAEAAAGSLAFLRKQISDLQKEIESTPGQSKALEPLIQQLKLAEDALKALEDRIERLKNPQAEAPPSAEEIARQLGFESSSAPGAPDETEADRLKLIEFNDFRLEEERLTTEELLKFRKGLSDEERRLRQEALSEEEELRENIRTLAISAVESMSSAFFQIRQNEVQQSTEAALSALDKEFAEKRRLAEGNQQAQARIEREYQKKKEALERQAAEKRRQIALKEAIIAGALAVVKALTIPGNVFGAIAAGVAAAAQIAVIASQQFAGGGMTGDGSPFQRPDRTGHKPVGVVHANEWVGPKWMVQHPYYGAQIAALEAVRQRGFADGGYPTTPTIGIAPLGAGGGSTAQVSLDAFMMLAGEFRAFRQEVSGWQSRLRVAYTDIESVGGELGAVRVEAGL